MLAEAGFSAGKDFPPITLLTNIGHHTQNRDYKWILDQWEEILRIDVTLEEVAWDDLVRRVRSGDFSIVKYAWVADYPDPDSFLRTNVNLSQGGWEHPEFKQIVERACNSRDQQERVQLYQAADQIIIDQVPILPLGYGRVQILAKPWVRAYPISPMGFIHVKDIIIEPH